MRRIPKHECLLCVEARDFSANVLLVSFNIINDLIVKNNIWHVITSTETACVDVLDEIGSNPLTEVWRVVGNDAHDFHLKLTNGTLLARVVHLRIDTIPKKKKRKTKFTGG